MQFIKLLAGLAIVSALAACGAGGGNPGNTGGGTSIGTSTGTGTASTPSSTTSVTAAVSSFFVSLEKNSIANNGSDESRLTVTTLDSSNNIVPNAAVQVSSDNNSVFIPPAVAVTGANGTYVGVLKSGADKSDRVINATVTVNGISKTVGLQVQGTKLTLSIVPSAAAPGTTVTLTVDAKDANGGPISGAPINISGVVSTSLTTGLNGSANVVFAVPSTGGTYNVNASGSGVQAVSSLVVSGGGGSAVVPAAMIPAGVIPSFAISPAVLSPNAAGSSTNQANFRFLILDASNTPIPNVRVRFQKNGVGTGNDGVISSGPNSIISNASGIAATTYIPGTESSPTNGVFFRACYKATDFTSATDCPFFVDTNITVAGSPASISIGDDNALQKDVGVYTQRFAVTVVDSAGRAVAGAPVSFGVDITHFGKGDYLQTNTFSTSPAAIGFAIPDLVTSPGDFGRRVACPNEDINRSKNLDSSEDINGNGVLDPKSSDVIIAADTPGVTSTDPNGIIKLKVTWLQKVATWMIYRVRVTTNVSGSESSAEASFPTYFVVGDDANAAPFKIPPYGRGACNSPF